MSDKEITIRVPIEAIVLVRDPTTKKGELVPCGERGYKINPETYDAIKRAILGFATDEEFLQLIGIATEKT